MARPLRMIQWATGNVGIEALRAIIDSPRLELVGLRVYSPEKIGRDAGELIGAGPVGVTATDDTESILAMDADCVCYTPLTYSLAEITALLRSGKNVVTSTGLLYPRALDGDVFEQLTDACNAGGVSFHSTGLNPGWIAEMLPVVSSAMCRRVRKVHSLEVCDVSDYGSKQMFIDYMKYGRPPAEFDADGKTLKRLQNVFRESVAMIAAAMGVEIEDLRHDRELVTADRDLESAIGTIAKGTIAGQKHRFTATTADGGPIIEAETRWKVVRADLGAGMPGDGECTWTITVEGDPSIRNVVHLAQTFDDSDPAKGAYSSQRGMVSIAAHALNAAPAVCAASPGVYTFLDLPVFGSTLGSFGPS